VAHAHDFQLEIQEASLSKRVLLDWRTAGLAARELALCEYAEKLTLNPGRMSVFDLEPLKEHGLTDQGLLELTQVVAYFNYINRIADGLGVDLEPFMIDSHT
jgi:uncharacterized peroxidase-related enzyme